MKAYVLDKEESSRYDADDPKLYAEICEKLGLHGWTVACGTGDSIEIHHDDGFVAELFYEIGELQ